MVSRRRFGGIDLYAYGDEVLDLEIKKICSGILSIVKENGPLPPGLIRYLLAKRETQEISQRTFSALLGAELRSGRLDAIVCEGETGKPFRIVIEAAAKPNFGHLLQKCLDMIPLRGSLTIAAVRDRLYPGKEEGNWTKASYLAARLARVGLVDFLDHFTIKRAEDTYHAISGIDDPLYSVDLLRLD